MGDTLSTSLGTPKEEEILPILGEQIGGGTYTNVYKGTLNSVPVAIKQVNLRRLQKYYRHDQEYAKKITDSFLREAEILKRTEHENIVKFFGICRELHNPNADSNNVLLVMELMSLDLWDYLNENRDSLLLEKQLDICHQITKGLHYLHTLVPDPVLHRDLHPGNVLVDESRNIFKITDFGQSKLRTSHYYADTHGPPGHRWFMPPEVSLSLNKLEFRRKSDIFSLGVTIMQIATQRTPSIEHGTTEVEKRSKDLESAQMQNHPLRPLIIRCLSDTLEERPDAQQVLDYLKDVENTGIAEDVTSSHSSSSQVVQSIIKQSKEKEFKSDLLLSGYEIEPNHLTNNVTPSADLTALVQSNCVYFCGGAWQSQRASRIVQVLDLDSKEWSELPPAPQIKSQAAFLHGLFTLIGGLDASASTKIPDVTAKLSSWANGNWENVYPPMKSPRLRHGVVASDHHLIVAGGISVAKGTHCLLDSVEVLEIATKQWMTAASSVLPCPLAYLQMALCDDYIYLCNAARKIGYTDVAIKEAWRIRLDDVIGPSSLVPTSQKISQEESQPQCWEEIEPIPNFDSGLLPKSTLPFLAGGRDSLYYDNKPCSEIHVYDPSQKKWLKVGELAEARTHPVLACCHDNSVLVVGGYKNWHRIERTLCEEIEQLWLKKTS